MPSVAAANPDVAGSTPASAEKHIRGWLTRGRFQRHLRRAVGVPDLERAKEYAHYLLPKDQDGELLPLTCPIKCFTVFGAGVYAYMRWCVLMKRIFFVAFLFSFPNMIDNIYGDGLQVKNWLSVQTIGNARSLTAAYGAAELLVLGTLLWGLFTAVEIVRKQETRLQPRETPGERTVILSGLPRRCPRAELPSRVARAMGRYGEVTRVVVARPIRDLLLRMPARHALLHRLRIARVERFLCAAGHMQRRTALEAAVERAVRILREHDSESKAMVGGHGGDEAGSGGDEAGGGGGEAAPVGGTPTSAAAAATRARR